MILIPLCMIDMFDTMGTIVGCCASTRILSYTIMSVITYLVDLIISTIKKTEKPEWEVSVVTIIVSILFAIYFFVSVSLF